MWLRSDIDESKQYQVALCQESSGRRVFRLVVAGSSAPSDTALLTEVVPTALLLQRNFHGIARTVRTTMGTHFKLRLMESGSLVQNLKRSKRMLSGIKCLG